MGQVNVEDSTPNSVFILAFGRTGSTLLSKLLAQAEDVFSAGEYYPVNIFSQPQLLCSCGQILKNCEYYKFLRDCMTNDDAHFVQSHFLDIQDFSSKFGKLKLYPVSSMFHFLRKNLLNYREIVNYTRIVDQLKRHTLEHYRRKVFVDAGKQYYQLSLYLQGNTKINRVIFLTRSPLGIYASNKRYMPDYNMDKFVSAWKRQNQQVEHLKAMSGNIKWFSLNFDELVAGSVNLETVLNFIGSKGNVKAENVMGSHFMGNKFVVNNEIPELRPDLRWQNELLESEVEYLREKLELD